MLTDEQKRRIADYEWLTDRERMTFEAIYRHGRMIEDVAAELELNRSTINRILKRLRDVASGQNET